MKDSELTAPTYVAGASRSGAGPALTDDPEGVGRTRAARIEEYLIQSVAQPDALRACLGAVTADLLTMHSRFASGIREALTAASSPVESLQKYARLVGTDLQLVRQVDRLIQLELRLDPGNRAKQPAVETTLP